MYLHITLPYGFLQGNTFLFFPLVSLSFCQIILALFRNTIIERKIGSTKLLYFTVFEVELLIRILLSGFKIGCSIAMVMYIATTHEFQIAPHPYLDQCFRCGYEILQKCQGYISPLPDLCLIVARGCNSEYCLLLCGRAVDIRQMFQVLTGRLLILSWQSEYILLNGEIIFKISSCISHIYQIYVC